MKTTFPVITIIMALCLLSSCNSNQEFDKNLSKTYDNVVKCYDAGYGIAAKTHDVWNDAIFQSNDVYGNYTGNWQDVLSKFTKDCQAKGYYDSLAIFKDKMDSLAGTLVDAPESRKDAYNDIISMVSDADALIRLVSNPTGSLKDFSEQVKTIQSSIEPKIDQFKIKYSKYLQKEGEKK